MNYLNIKSKDYSDIGFSFKKYNDYLIENSEYLCENIRRCVLSNWYYDWSDHRCPHDSWLTNVSIVNVEKEFCDIEMKLLGSYHDLHIVYSYTEVNSFEISKSSRMEWQLDEFQICQNNKKYKIHFIKWSSENIWRIKFKGKFSFKIEPIS